MTRRWIAGIVWLCMIALPLQGWGAMLPAACGHAMTMRLDRQPAMPASMPMPLALPAAADASHSPHGHAGVSAAASIHALAAAPHAGSSRHASAAACALCASCAACPLLAGAVSLMPAPFVLSHRLGSTPQIRYTSASTDVPHPPPRSPRV